MGLCNNFLQMLWILRQLGFQNGVELLDSYFSSSVDKVRKLEGILCGGELEASAAELGTLARILPTIVQDYLECGFTQTASISADRRDGFKAR